MANLCFILERPPATLPGKREVFAMHRPLVVIAIGFGAGIILAAWQGLWAFALLASLCIACLLWQQRPKPLLLALIAAVCGLLWLQLRTPVWPGAYESYQADVRIITAEATANSTQLTVQVLSLAGQPLPWWNPVKARLTLTQANILAPGDQLSGQINWRAPSQPLNPGEFNYAAYLNRQGILASGFINDVNTLEHTLAARKPWPLRDWLLARAARLTGASGELLGTLTLGTKPGTWAESWRQTGLAHVLSISGFHIGLVLLALLGLLKLCRLSINQANLIAAICLLLYGYVLGPKPAVWRAIIMALIGMLAVATRRMRDWPSAIAAAAILLLLYNPNFLWDAGWQLSFAATIGILALSPLIRERLPLLPWKLDWLISASLAAQLATLPLVLHHFYLLTPLSLIFNIILTPLLPAALITGLLYLLLPAIGGLMLPFLDFFYSTLLRLVDWFASWPLASFSPGAPPLVLLLAYIVLLVLLFSQRNHWRPYVATALVISCALLFMWQPLERLVSNTYDFCVLSVGQGSASALHLPGGDAILFDVGGGNDAVGRQVIVPYLRYRGTWKIDAIYLSHLHDDHIVGLSDVLAAFPVSALYVPATSAQTPAYAELTTILQDYDVQIHHWTLGDTQLHGALQVAALNPLPGPAEDENEDSLVLALEWPNLSVLVPGDIGAREADLLQYLPLQPDVLLVPHHGSANSSSEAFLRVLRPQHAIISTGRNLYGHPAPATLGRLARYGQQIWRTDQHGAITILNNHHGHRIIPFLQP